MPHPLYIYLEPEWLRVRAVSSMAPYACAPCHNAIECHTPRTSQCHSHQYIHLTAYHTDGTPRRPVTHALAVAWLVPQLCKRRYRKVHGHARAAGAACAHWPYKAPRREKGAAQAQDCTRAQKADSELQVYVQCHDTRGRAAARLKHTPRHLQRQRRSVSVSVSISVSVSVSVIFSFSVMTAAS